MAETVLELKDVRTYFAGPDGVWAKAVDGVSFSVRGGETVCVVGESGCGKSMTALSVMGLVPKPHGRIMGGEILLHGEDLTKLPDEALYKIRGGRISMIFQEPMTSLNPVKTIGSQVAEAVLTHTGVSKAEAMRQTVEMLEMVGIPRAKKIAREYPHQLSGGMRQRVMIAMALITKPDLLIADEPTTALDVTIQAQVLNLIRDLKEKTGTAVLFITHDLGIVAEMADYVVVMYAGQVVETTDARTLFKAPAHPYTRALLSAIPFMDQQKEVLYAIRGTVPGASAYTDTCRFQPRCDDFLAGRCRADAAPALRKIGPNHFARCFGAGEEATP